MRTLTLKWGTLKGWGNIEDKEAFELLKKYHAEPTSFSVAMQRDTQSQKEILCKLCDRISEIGGEIYNDWDDKTMTAEEAKDYILNYGKTAEVSNEQD